jgi:hypothetical protein
VLLQAKDSQVASFASSSSTAIDTRQASQPVADEMLYKALKVAIGGLDFERAAKEIEASRHDSSQKQAK